MIRLDKFLCEMEIGTRSQVKDMVKKGMVSVDGEVVKKADYKFDETAARVCVNGKELSYQKFYYYMLNKPQGVVSATTDNHDKTVLDLLKGAPGKDMFPVGRLDKDTEGLLLITNDGDLAHRLLAPKKHVDKLYYAKVDGEPDSFDAKRFEEGIVLADGTECLPAKLEYTGSNECFVTVMEGKYHQVKRMLAACGKPVLELRRLSIGGLCLDEDLGPGGFRELDESDLCRLFNGI